MSKTTANNKNCTQENPEAKPKFCYCQEKLSAFINLLKKIKRVFLEIMKDKKRSPLSLKEVNAANSNVHVTQKCKVGSHCLSGKKMVSGGRNRGEKKRL